MNEVTYRAEFVPLHLSPMWMNHSVNWLVTVGNISSPYSVSWRTLPDAKTACNYGLDTNCRCPPCADIVRTLLSGKQRNGSQVAPPAKDDVISWLRANPATSFRMRQLLGANTLQVLPPSTVVGP